MHVFAGYRRKDLSCEWQLKEQGRAGERRCQDPGRTGRGRHLSA